MRHYQWNDPSYEERKFAGHELTFVCDLWNANESGVRCVCGYCDEEIEIFDGVDECPQCANDLIFPRADW